MARNRSFDLWRDPRALLEQRWLEPGENLVNLCPIWRKPPRLEGIPKPMPTAAQLAGKVLRGTGWVIVGIIVIALMAAAGGGDAGGGSRKFPRLIARGDGSASMAGQVVVPTLRRRGVWALTDRRLAFLALDGDILSEWLSDPSKPPADSPPPATVTVDQLMLVPSHRFSHRGTVPATRKGRFTGRVKTMGRYHRIDFPDGSSLELLHNRLR